MVPEIYIPQLEQDQGQHEQVFREPARQEDSSLNFIEIMRGRREEREELKQERLADREKYRQERREKRNAGCETVSLDEDGHLRVTLPCDFVRSPADPESFRSITRFHHKETPDAAVGYEKGVYKPAEEVDARLRALLREPPHRLSAQEVDEIASAIPNALYGYDGDAALVSLETQDINGKRVLVMETSYNHEDRRTYGIFANPDRANETIDAVWFEAPNRHYKQLAGDAAKSLHSIKWNDSSAAMQVLPTPRLKGSLPIFVPR